ncbi:MAG: hypothetical protein Q9219_006475 [cf. Caloplaca sp. 3 TL-2023]
MPGPPSALVGQPPLTADDKTIVHGWQVLFGMGKMDPSKGLTIVKPPPPGVAQDSAGPQIAVGCAISLALMALFTGTRLALRAGNRNLVWGMDDWAIIIATLIAMTVPILYCYKLVNAGAGQHVWHVTYWELANHQTVAIPGFALFYIAVAAIKISIILFYMRLTAFASRGWMIAHRVFIVALVICALVSMFVTIFYCDPPISGNIREVGRRGQKLKCIPLVNLIIGFNVWHILSDCLLLVVPFMLLWRVQMKTTTKLKVCIAGVVGFGNVGLAMARTIVQATAKQSGGFDLTYTATDSFAYSASELTLGVLTANLPVLSFVVTKTVEMFSWHSVSSDNGSPSPDSGNHKRHSYKRRLHDDSKMQSKTEVKGLREQQSWEREGSGYGKGTVRQDLEYGPDDSTGVVGENVGKAT